MNEGVQGIVSFPAWAFLFWTDGEAGRLVLSWDWDRLFDFSAAVVTPEVAGDETFRPGGATLPRSRERVLGRIFCFFPLSTAAMVAVSCSSDILSPFERPDRSLMGSRDRVFETAESLWSESKQISYVKLSQ